MLTGPKNRILTGVNTMVLNLMKMIMPSPSENRAVDLVLATFPGSVIEGWDGTTPKPITHKVVGLDPVFKSMPKKLVKSKIPKKKRPGKNQDAMFG